MSLAEKITEAWNKPEIFHRADPNGYGEQWLKVANIKWDEFHSEYFISAHPKRAEEQKRAIKETISLIFDSRADIEDEDHEAYIRQYAQLISEVRKQSVALSLIDNSLQIRLCAEVLIEKGVL